MTAGRCSSGTIRVRSAWASSTASNGARSRAGAAASSPGRGASGRSKSSRPASSRRTTSCVAQALDDRPEARQARPRLHVGGGGGTERGEVVAHERLAGGLAGRRRRVETVLGQGERGRARERPAVLGGHHHERQPHPDRVAERAHVGVRELGGEPRRAARRTCAGRSSRRARAAARTASRSSVARRAFRTDRSAASSAGSTTGRCARKAAALTRWSVARCSVARTTSPSASARAEVLGREPLEPRPQRGEGRSRLLRLQPAEPVDRLGDVEARLRARAAAGARASPARAPAATGPRRSRQRGPRPPPAPPRAPRRAARRRRSP